MAPHRSEPAPVCLVCGFGASCAMSALPWVFGDDLEVTPDKFHRVEEQREVWQKSAELGGLSARKLTGKAG